ncbi:MAG: MATE family efflux transporter [Oscillospiraceae bacterium]|nr:MATE family efflux transporter [Oscillospiraceae bacterium]
MRKDVDMLSGPLGPSIIRFAVPVILTTMLQSMFTTIDLVVIGQFCGSLKQAAVTSTTAMTTLMIGLFTGLSLGAGLTVARTLGSRRTEDISGAVHTAIPTAIVGGLLLGVIGVIFAPELLEMMNTPADVLPLASVYMRIYFSGIVFNIVYNFCAAICRAMGDSKTPLYFLLISGGVRAVLNLLFVAVCKFENDIAAVACSAVISQATAATLMITALHRRTDDCKFYLKKMRIRKAPLLSILRIGIPAGLQASLFSLSNVITATALNSFNSAALISGNGASANIEAYTDAIGLGFSQTAPNFIAQNLGARQYDRIKKSFITCLGLGAAIVLVTSLTMYAFGEELLGLYITDSPEAIASGLIRMRYNLALTFLCISMSICTSSLQGLGYATVATSISLITACGLRVLWFLTLFNLPQFHTEDGLYAINPFTWGLTVAIEATLFFVLLKKKVRKEQLTET